MKNIYAFWRGLHLYVSMFFLTVILLFAITGSLYIMGCTGNLNTQTYTVMLEQPLPRPLEQHLDAQAEAIRQFAKKNNLEVPEGDAKKGKTGVLLGSSTGYHIVIVPDKTKENVVSMQVNHPNWHYKAVMLHKAKCGLAFKVFGVITGLGLILLYISGIYLIWRNKELRNRLLVTSLVGLLVMLVLGYFSL